MAAGRKPLAPAVQHGPDFVTETPDEQATQELMARELVHSGALTPAEAIAKDLGYTGTLTVESLELEIRFYHRRTAEACIEMGKRLLVLKEMTPHGEFLERIGVLGFSKSTAYRFMQTARKFSKLPKLGSLEVTTENAGKFLELLVLDDEEIEGLNNGESICGITLDDVDCMSASELRRALRNARSNQEAETAQLQAAITGQLAAKDRLIADGKKRIAQLVEEKNARESMTDAEHETELERQMTEAVLTAIGATIPLRKAVDAIRRLDHVPTGLYVAMQGGIHRALTEVESIANDYGISLDFGLPSLSPEDPLAALEELDDPNAGEVFPEVQAG